MMIPKQKSFFEDTLNRYNRDMMIVNGTTINTYEKWKEREQRFNEDRVETLKNTIKELDSIENPLEKILCYMKYRNHKEGGYGRSADVHLVHTWMSEFLTGELEEEPFEWEYVGNSYRYVYAPAMVTFDLSALRVSVQNRASIPYCDDFTLKRNLNPVRESLLLMLKPYSEKMLRVPTRELYKKCMEWVKAEPSNRNSYYPEENKSHTWSYKRQIVGILLFPNQTKKFVERLELQNKVVVDEKELIAQIENERKEAIASVQDIARKSNLMSAVNKLKEYSEFEVYTPDWFPEK